MKFLFHVYLYATCLSIIYSNYSMENSSNHSLLNEISFINNTGKPLKVIFDKGRLPVTLSRVLPAGTCIPAVLRNRCTIHNKVSCRECADHPLITYNPATGNTHLVYIPDRIRKNFSYGIFLSETPNVQIIYLNRVSSSQRMLHDFRDSTSFKICTEDTESTPQLTTPIIPIIQGRTYHICYDERQGLFVEEIVGEIK